MDRINRGDIWTIELLSHPKPRPALIVSINAINDFCPDVLVLPITSKPGPLRVTIPDQPEQTGLRIRSFVKCESLGPIYKHRLKKRIGALPPHAWGVVEAGIRRVLGLHS
ncbi:MAG: type II toxin-antitoxin system PemK/MazF family toxin [Nitrospirae bacterium]|nr:MAG: type II toxin-antitoxin system PemK/MazF family toxin [Nitrospirota bacterium]